MTSKLKILQTNLGRSRGAHDMALASAAKRGADIIVASEPNKMEVEKTTRWIKDQRADVGVFFKNKNVQVERAIAGEGHISIVMEEMTIICCYSSPNIDQTAFKKEVDSIMEESKKYRECIILGDLNAKSTLWGSRKSDARGEYWAECMASRGLVILNTGTRPTFRRGGKESWIDITCATEKTAKAISEWEVLEDETLSDHEFILFGVNKGAAPAGNKTVKVVCYEWDTFRDALKLLAEKSKDDETVLPERCTEAIRMAMKLSEVKRSTPRKMPYWWNSDLEEMRKKCAAARRMYTRAAKGAQGGENRVSMLKEGYKARRRALRREVIKAKKRMWSQLCEDLERDVWGQGYKIATKTLNCQRPYALAKSERVKIARDLFPNSDEIWKYRRIPSEEGKAFSIEELETAAKKIKAKKAPGPDGILPEAVKEAVKTAPKWMLGVINHVLKTEDYPSSWKTAKLILIPKGNPRDHKFRPICLLNTVSKLCESLIKARLEEELRRTGGLSERQFGFREGRSTTQAINMVQEARRGSHKWCALVTLDIKNAFNTASWRLIMEELQRRGVAPYILNIIGSYLSNRKIRMGRAESLKVDAGVPQGSVLGPTLWNVLYDGVLREVLPEGAETVAFADDLAAVVKADTKEDLNYRVNETIRRLKYWMARNKLKIAAEKTEAIILKGPRKKEGINFRVDGNTIEVARSVRYLGVYLDDRNSFKKHIEQVVEKAGKKANALAAIMPNIGGPGSKKREALAAVVHSILLYGAPVWAKSLTNKTYREKLEKGQRVALLRAIGAYRTVSTRAAQVIAGLPPIWLLAEERERVYQKALEYGEADRDEERLVTITRWQQQWDKVDGRGSWTRRLIPSLKEWVACKHRNVDYFLTQALSGHGSFGSYLKRIGKELVDVCLYCGQEDDAEHTLFVCERWEESRTRLEDALEVKLSKDNLISTMIKGVEEWNSVHKWIREIMNRKAKDE